MSIKNFLKKSWNWLKKTWGTILAALFVVLLVSTPIFQDDEIIISAGQTNPIGYEFINDSIHIWNLNDDYYFNKSSGIQFTNHYEDYWSRNVFCIGYYNGNEWVKVKCADDLSNFSKSIISDNSSFVNATLWKDFSYGSYDLRLGIRYHLGLHDKSLSVIPFVKNTGVDIPFDLGFGWIVKDWNIPSSFSNDKMYINDSVFDLNDTYSLLFRNITVVNESKPLFIGFDDKSFLKLKWDKDLDYAVKMFGNGNQEDFYIGLLINAGHFSSGQTKNTVFNWIDATTLFTADAETGDLTEWDSTTTGGGTMTADSVSAKDGSYGFNMSYDGSGGVYGTGNFALQNNVYLKADVYISDTCSAGAWGQVNFFSLTRWGSGAIVKLKMDGSGNCYRWGIPGLTTDSNFSTGEWLELEFHYNNTGVIQFWVNNNLIQDITDNSETRLIDTANLGGTGTLNAGSYFFFDNVEVSDERIGGGDSTAPTWDEAPYNITIGNSSAIGIQWNATDETALDEFFSEIGRSDNFSLNISGYFSNNSFLSVGNFSLNISVNDTSNNILRSEIYVDVYDDSTPAGSCTYSSGQWNIDCSDTCTISANVDLNGNNVVFDGSGIVTITDANLTNVENTTTQNGCTVIREKGGGIHR